MPVSLTDKAKHYVLVGFALLLHAHDHFAALGKFDGVANQVDQHLAQPAGIAAQACRHVAVN